MTSGLQPLKVGLLLDDWVVPSWIASIVSGICVSDAAEIVATICPSNNKSQRTHFFQQNHGRSSLSRLGRLYLGLDELVSNPVPNALESIDLTSKLEKYPLIRIEAIFEGAYFRFSEPDTACLRKLDCDVLLLFCDGLPANQTLSLARYGVWSFLDHELLVTSRVPTGFWEVLEHRTVMNQSLHAYLPGSERSLILQEYAGLIDRRSIKRARNNFLWKSASFVDRKLQALHRARSLGKISRPRQDSDYSPPEQVGSNFLIAKNVLCHASRCVKDLFVYCRYVAQWSIGYKFGPSNRVIDDDLAEFRWLVPPKDRIWADPFPVKYDGQYFLFFEECLFGNKEKGHISVAPIGQNGFSQKPTIILKCEHHLSYPFILFWEGEWYLIPESEEANRIDVYKFDPFPYRVKFHTTIMDNVRAVDTTICEMDGQWWMFTGIAPNGTYNVDELFLFYSNHPFGPWVPHPQNPVKSDVRSARSAGNIFSWHGKYHRPAQDCSKGYGYGIRLHEIDVLNREKFVEREVGTILPHSSDDFIGVHTFNRADDLTVIDAKKWCRRTRSATPSP
ncbi:MAG: hypothetical protein HXY51_16595 [Nitrospirae bacterium]|nr:hypothetical protein [Nitrospirota bacterium]